MKTTKKFLSIILAILIIVTTVPFAFAADSNICQSTVLWTTSGNTVKSDFSVYDNSTNVSSSESGYPKALNSLNGTWGYYMYKGNNTSTNTGLLNVLYITNEAVAFESGKSYNLSFDFITNWSYKNLSESTVKVELKKEAVNNSDYAKVIGEFDVYKNTNNSGENQTANFTVDETAEYYICITLMGTLTGALYPFYFDNFAFSEVVYHDWSNKDGSCANAGCTVICDHSEYDADAGYTDGFRNCCGEIEPAVNNDGVYEISNAGQLLWFAQQVNSGNTTISGKLMNSIDLSGVTYTPIGTTTYPYTGTFDGQGYSIQNMNISSSEAYQGLFGVVGAGAHIKGVIIDASCSISGGDYTAALVGGSVRYASGEVTSKTASTTPTSAAASIPAVSSAAIPVPMQPSSSATARI